MCQLLHCLPGAGGLLEQDQLMVRRMMIVINAQAERKQIEYEKEKKK